MCGAKVRKCLNLKTNMETLYWVHWYSNGFCYRSTHSVPKDKLKEFKQLAKILGEKLVIEKM